MRESRVGEVLYRWLFAVLVGLALGAILFPSIGHASCIRGPHDTLEAFAGRSTRIIDNSTGHAWGASRVLDYCQWFKVNIGYINEGNMHPTENLELRSKRDGIFLMPRMERRFTQRFSTYFEVGPYITGTTTTQNEHSRIEYKPTLMGGFGANYTLGPISVGGRWLHVIGVGLTGSADVFTINLGFTN